MIFDDVCMACKAGLHPECSSIFDGTLDVTQTCCCNGKYTLAGHLAYLQKLERASGRDKKGEAAELEDDGPGKARGDSGYIHPDAWPSTRDIGTLTDPKSTGRKRAAEMFPITGGQVCDWARQANAGGGPVPIIGCMGSPASDIHHGPDKNTLNNAVARRGVGDTDNLWFLCSDCHNLWHALNDPYYPEYDRVAQQAEPWVPVTDEPWSGHDPRPATFDEMSAEEQRREERRRQRGREHRGRNAEGRAEPNLTVGDD